jgi:predicted DNA-binding protein
MTEVKKSFSIGLSKNLYEKLKNRAEIKDLNVSTYAKTLIVNALNEVTA